MKRRIGIAAAILVLALGNTLPAGAMGGSHGHFGFRGQSRGGEHHEFRERPGDGHRQEFFRHDRFHRHFGTEVFIVSPFWWGPDWWWPPSPSYAGPATIVPQEPPVYLQPQYYWYYCPDPPGYYPYVQQCPSAWLTVVPPAATPGP